MCPSQGCVCPYFKSIFSARRTLNTLIQNSCKQTVGYDLTDYKTPRAVCCCVCTGEAKLTSRLPMSVTGKSKFHIKSKTKWNILLPANIRKRRGDAVRQPEVLKQKVDRTGEIVTKRVTSFLYIITTVKRFFSSKISIPAPGSTQNPIQRVLEDPPSGIQWQGPT